MASISSALANVKDYFRTHVPDRLILQACADVDRAWRERQLGPVVTTYLFLQQVRHGNTACTHLRKHLKHGKSIRGQRELSPGIHAVPLSHTRKNFQDCLTSPSVFATFLDLGGEDACCC